jgi:iron complex outermembrane receptor protein
MNTLRAVLALATLAPLLAQGQAEDAISVTATRVERPTLGIPAAVDRVRGEDIRWGKTQVNLSESLSRVPGISVHNRNNYAQDLQITSRGFGSRSTFGIRGLRLVADGIPASFPDGQGQVSHFDLGSAGGIEVLRGPFSVMHGNASGGVISIATERGTPGLEGSFSAGSLGTRRAALKLGGDGWLVSSARFSTDGYREHSKAVREQLNAKAEFSPGGGTRVTLVANSFASPETQDPSGLTRAQMEADPKQVAAPVLQFDTRKSQAQNQFGAAFSHRLSEATTLHASLHAGERVVRQYLGFLGAAPATTSGGVLNLDRGYGGASLRLETSGALLGRPLTVSFGGEVERMVDRRTGFVNNNGQIGALRRDEDNIVSATGAYAQAEWRFADKWIALAGLRASRVAFELEDFFIVAGNPDDSGSRSYSAVTPALGLLYSATPSISLYANHGRGFETPTFVELAYRPGGSGMNFALEASRSRHLEAGVKAVLGAGTRLNLALFEVATEREIVVNTNVGGRSTFKNAGRTRRSGLELGLESSLPFGLEAVLAWTLLDATFRDAFTAGAITVPSGNRLPGVARNTLYGELRWKHTPSGFTLALEAQHKSRVAVDDVNSDFAAGYTTANVAAGLTQSGSKWTVTEFLRIDNLADRRYAGSVIVNEGNGRFFEPSPGRTALVGVQAKLAY